MSRLIKNGQIYLFGAVMKDEWIWPEDTGCFSAAMVVEALTQFSGDVGLVVNSDGGVPTEGEAIRAALEAHPGKVTAMITGAAHSAASLMVMGADQIEMSSGSLMLVHDPSAGRAGNSAELRAAADDLDVMADGYAGVYATRAGITSDQAREIMRAETLFTAPEAVEAGFADVVTSEAAPAQADTAMQYNVARAAMDAARDRVTAAQMKFEATSDGLEPGESHTPNPGQVANETFGVQTMSKDNIAPATPTTPVADLVDAGAVTMQATTDERARVKAIRDAATPFMTHVGQDRVDQMIDEGTSLDDANKVIMAAAAAGQPRTSRVEILRDERETMRHGMADAMVAQMLGKDPSDERAHPYMEMSMVEMATDLTGSKRARTAGAKADVLMMAAHGVSDFPLILANSFNTVIESAYDLVDPTFDAFSREMTFNDFRAHDIVRPDNFPTLQKIGENGEIKFGTFGEDKETLALASYATGLTVSRQLMINDHMGAIADVLMNAAGIVPEFEEETFWAMLLSNPKLSDNVVLFHASHGNVGAAGAITTTTIGEGRKAMRSHKQKDKRSVKSNAPAILIVGPELETEAEKFLSPVLAAEQVHVNPLAKSLRLVVSEEITDATWYLAVDKSKKTHSFKHGYLDGYRTPRVRIEDPFGAQGTSLTIEHDFACGAVGHMGAYKRG